MAYKDQKDYQDRKFYSGGRTGSRFGTEKRPDRRGYGPDRRTDGWDRRTDGRDTPRGEKKGERRGEYQAERKPGAKSYRDFEYTAPRRDNTRPPRGERPERTERPFRPERSQRAEWNNRPDRNHRPDWNSRPERNYQPERDFQPEWAEQPEMPAREDGFGRDEYERIPDEAYILTGRNPIREALKNGRDLEKLLVQKGELSGSAKEIVSMAKEQKVMVQVVEKKRLDEIAPQHQGLIAFASAYQYAEVEEILAEAEEKNEAPFLILLDGITDPHNLGAILRSAECAGAHGVIVPQHRSVGLTPAAVKASAGAVEYVKVARVANLNKTIDELKKRNIWVYAVTMNGEDYRTMDFSNGTALVIGSEGEGISRLTEEKCDYAVSLPMKGHLDSLNASVAAGIMMYAVLRTRS